MTIDALEKYLNSQGIEVELLRKIDKLKLLQNWRKHYALKLRKEIGSEVVENWDLYIFEEGFLSCMTDSEAEEEYAGLLSEPCYVIPSDAGPGFWCSKLPPANLNRFCLEGARPWPLTSAGGGVTWAESNILVFPEHISWTLAIHAEGCYFTRLVSNST